MKRILALVTALCLLTVGLTPLPPVMASGEQPLLVEAEGYQVAQGDVWAAENDFGGNGWNAEDWSGGKGIRFGGNGAYASYTFDVEADGNYEISGYVASRSGNSGYVQFTLDGTDYYLYIPDDCGTPTQAKLLLSQNTEDVAGAIALTAGTHTLKVTCATAAWCYLDKYEFVKQAEAEPEPEDPGTLTVEAESYQASQGDVWAAENDFGNNGWNAEDWSGGKGIRFGGNGAYASYTFNVEADGNYEISGYVASRSGNSGYVQFTLDETDYYLYIPDNCGTPTQAKLLLSQNTEDVAGVITLTAGPHTLKVTCATAAWCYLDKYEFVKQAETEPEPEPEPEEPGTLTVEAEGYQASQGDVWAAENDFGGNSWNAEDWSGGKGIRFGGNGAYASYTFSLQDDGYYAISGYAASLADNQGYVKFTLDGTDYHFYIPAGCSTPTQVALLGSQDEKDVVAAVELTAGEHTLTVTCETAAWCYLDKYEFVKTEKPEEPGHLTVEAESYQAIQGNVWAAENDFSNNGWNAEDWSGGKGIRFGGNGAYASYTFSLKEDGYYAISGYAASLADNQGYVKFTLDGTDYYLYIPAGCSTPTQVALLGSQNEQDVVTAVELTAGEHTLTVTCETAAWCYLDKYEFVKTEKPEDPGPKPPDPPEPPVEPVERPSLEAEDCTYTGGFYVSDGDQNFTEVSGGKALRNGGASGTISGKIAVPETRVYQVQIYVGSRVDNQGTDTFTIDGSTYTLLIPEWTAPGWHIPLLRDATGKLIAGITITGGEEHTFTLNSNSAWCYYDKIEFVPGEREAGPDDLIVAWGEPSNLNFGLSGQGRFQGDLGAGTAVRVYGDVTFRYSYHVPTAGLYSIQVYTAAKNTDGGAAVLTVGENSFPVVVAGSGLGDVLPLTVSTAASSVWLDAGDTEVTLSTGSANWCYFDRIVFTLAEKVYTEAEVRAMLDALPDYDAATLDCSNDYAAAKAAMEQYNAVVEAQGWPELGSAYSEKMVLLGARLNALRYMTNAPAGALWFELEEGELIGNTGVGADPNAYGAFSGSGYAFLFDKALACDIFVPKAGTYDVYIRAGRELENDKCDYVQFNGGEKLLVATHAGAKKWTLAAVGTENYENGKVVPKMPIGGIRLNKGWNRMDLTVNWGYCAYDAIVLYPGTGTPATAQAGSLVEPQIGPGWPSVSEELDWKEMTTGTTVMNPVNYEDPSWQPSVDPSQPDASQPGTEPGQDTPNDGGSLWIYLAAGGIALAAIILGFLLLLLRKKRKG